MGNSPQIGLRDLYYALITNTEGVGVAPIYAAPVQIAEAINAKISPKVQSEILWADDNASEVLYNLGEVTVELEAKDLSIAMQAALGGHTISGGVVTKKSTDIPPYLAIGFRAKKVNGNYRYYWLYKGKFDWIDNENESLSDKAKAQTPKLKGTFMKRQFDDAWQKIADMDDPGYIASIGANWYTYVDNPLDSTAPVISSSTPLANATSISVNTTYAWVFSKNLNVQTVNSTNFYLIKDTDGSTVTATVAYNDATKTVTLTPTGALTSATKYLAMATFGVLDLPGNHLVATARIFTTA
jgi:phi13 family phage major tail protein